MEKEISSKDSFIVPVRFNKEQLTIIDDLCKSSMITRSELIRKSVLNKNIRSSFDKESLSELRKIGVNINQIARTLNSERKINNIDFLIVKFDLLISHLKDILSKIKGV